MLKRRLEASPFSAAEPGFFLVLKNSSKGSNKNCPLGLSIAARQLGSETFSRFSDPPAKQEAAIAS
jgi:hypothetical protein